MVRDSEPGAGCAQQAWKVTDSSTLWASGLLEEHPSPLDSGTGTIGAHGTIRLRIRFDATGALGGGIPVQVSPHVRCSLSYDNPPCFAHGHPSR